MGLGLMSTYELRIDLVGTGSRDDRSFNGHPEHPVW